MYSMRGCILFYPLSSLFLYIHCEKSLGFVPNIIPNPVKQFHNLQCQVFSFECFFPHLPVRMISKHVRKTDIKQIFVIELETLEHDPREMSVFFTDDISAFDIIICMSSLESLFWSVIVWCSTVLNQGQSKDFKVTSKNKQKRARLFFDKVQRCNGMIAATYSLKILSVNPLERKIRAFILLWERWRRMLVWFCVVLLSFLTSPPNFSHEYEVTRSQCLCRIAWQIVDYLWRMCLCVQYCSVTVII